MQPYGMGYYVPRLRRRPLHNWKRLHEKSGEVAASADFFGEAAASFKIG
jgi:hypothetical protein